MFFLSSYSFLFSCVYLVFIYFLLCVDRFFIFWSVIELRTLVFIGVCYSRFKNNFRSLLVFFIIQTISALILLLFFLADRTLGFTFSILLKLSIFPFYFWYIKLLVSFPNMILFFSRTLFKLPSVLIINYFFWLIDSSIMTYSSLLTILLGAVTMLYTSELRIILIASSVVNNSWFFLSQSFRLTLFTAYFTVYSFFLLLIFCCQGDLIVFNSFRLRYGNLLLILRLFTISGLPPFPLFYLKMLIIYNITFYFLFSQTVILLAILTVVSTLRYIKHLFSSLVMSFTSSLLFIYY